MRGGDTPGRTCAAGTTFDEACGGEVPSDEWCLAAPLLISDAILSPTANTADVGARAGYPQITVPAGYDPIRRRPAKIAFSGTAGDDAELIAFAYAYERAAGVRRTPSEVNPATWHCVAPIRYVSRTCRP